MITMGRFEKVAMGFSNGVIVVNTTPHELTFISPEGEIVNVPSSVPEGGRAGYAVVNAHPAEIEVGPGLVQTIFEPSPEGQAIIDAIKEEFETPDCKLRIVGSLAAANAYKDIVGMVPAPGFERMPPAEKRMSVEKFNVGSTY